MRKEIFAFALIAFLFMFVTATLIYADDEIRVTIDGTPVIFPDQGPTIFDSRTLVPLRGVFEELGFEVAWDNDSQQATLTRESDVVVITIGSRDFTVNGENHWFEFPARIINGRVMLPIRAVVESVGYIANWNNATRTVVITTEPPRFTADDFTLEISVAETTLPMGEDFRVTAHLRNKSGEDIEIAYDFLMWPRIQDWHVLTEWGDAIDWPYPTPRMFAADHVFTENWPIGHTLEPGTHELTFTAGFYLNWRQDDQQRISLTSNRIELIVVKDDAPRDDFTLTISVEEASRRAWEGFYVHVELKNNSGEDHEITHTLLFQPFIPNWSMYRWIGGRRVDLNEQHTRFIESGGIIRNIGLWGYEEEALVFRHAGLDQGTHELRFRAVFYLNWGQENQERIEIWSNTILLNLL